MSDEYKSPVPENATLDEILENYTGIINKYFFHDVYDIKGADVFKKKVNKQDLQELRNNINRTIRFKNKDNYNNKLWYYGSLFLLIIILILNIAGLILANKWGDSIEDDGNTQPKTWGKVIKKIIYEYYKHWFSVFFLTVLSFIIFFISKWDESKWIAFIIYPISWVITGLITT